MTAAPPLSVVVPAYRNAEYIDETMRSILDQDFGDFELIVADHSSPDETMDRLRAYADDPRVRLLTTEAGGGAERNFNRVSAEARGEFLKLVCGDDILLPGILGRQVALLREHPGAVMTAGPRRLVDSRGRTVVARRGLGPLREPTAGRAAIRATVRLGSNLFGEPGCVTMRREPLAHDGFWYFAHPFLVDQATYMRLLLHGDFVPDPELGSAFRMNIGQTSVSLVASQYGQVSAYHEEFHRAHPTVLSRADVRRGNANAWLTAQKRRMAYTLLRTRM